MVQLKYICRYKTTPLYHLWGGADKSLAWLTSRCHRMESIVSLERWGSSHAELQVFSCYRGWKEACQATHAISTTWKYELSSGIFFLPGKVHHSWTFGHAEALREVGPEMPEHRSKTSRYQSSEQLMEFFWRDPNDFLSQLVTMGKT